MAHEQFRNHAHTIRLHTGCPRRNVADFGRIFLMLKYTDIPQNTYIQSWTVTEILTREMFGLLALPRTVFVKPTRDAYAAHVRPWEWNAFTLQVRYEWLVTCTEFAKIPFVFSHLEYFVMHFVYRFWDGNARASVDEYQKRLPTCAVSNVKSVLQYCQIFMCHVKCLEP